MQDILFVPDGSSFFSSSDLVSRDSADRNLMAWDFRTGVTLSNQIYQVNHVTRKEVFKVSDQVLHKLDPVVQSIVSLTISLRHKFVKQISAKVTNTLLFFVEKM